MVRVSTTTCTASLSQGARLVSKGYGMGRWDMAVHAGKSMGAARSRSSKQA